MGLGMGLAPHGTLMGLGPHGTLMGLGPHGTLYDPPSVGRQHVTMKKLLKPLELPTHRRWVIQGPMGAQPHTQPHSSLIYHKINSFLNLV